MIQDKSKKGIKAGNEYAGKKGDKIWVINKW